MMNAQIKFSQTIRLPQFKTISLACLLLIASALSSCKGKQKFSELDAGGKDYHGIPQSESLSIPPDYKLPPTKS